MVRALKVVSAGFALLLGFGSFESASARHLHRHHVRVYHFLRAHPVRLAPVVTGSSLGIALGEIGPGIPGAATAEPYPRGYGYYAPGYDYYGPGFASPGY